MKHLLITLHAEIHSNLWDCVLFVRLCTNFHTKTCIITMYYFYSKFHLRKNVILWCKVSILFQKRIFLWFRAETSVKLYDVPGYQTWLVNCGAKQMRVKTHAGQKWIKIIFVTQNISNLTFVAVVEQVRLEKQ